MPFAIEFSEDAERQLGRMTARDRNIVLDAIEPQLTHEPTVPTRNRKLLRENPLAAWQLRVGDIRVLYNVDGEHATAIVVAIGVKTLNVLTIDETRYSL